MRKQGRRERRIVGVVASEQHIRWDRFRDLDETAVVTEGELQRKARLRLAQLPFLQEGVGDRLRPEIEEGGQLRS